MLDLPRKTHRYFIEPLSNTRHVIKSMKMRFLNFIDSIRRSKKEVLRCVLRMIEHDCRSNTGRNLRKLFIEADEAAQDIASTDYKDVCTEDIWKVNFVKEIVEIKAGRLKMTTLSFNELNVIAEYVCCT